MKIKGVIFDFDGIIVNSEPYWEIADKVIVSQEGKDFLSETKSLIMGLSPIESIRLICKVHNILTPPEELLARREALMKRFYDNVIELNYGANDILEYLYERDITLALASSTPLRLFENALKRLKIHKFFKHIVTSEDINNSKPNPEIFIRAQNLMRLPQEELMIVEDSRAGVEGAIRAGIKVIWLKNNNTDIRGVSPNYIINSLSEIRLFCEQDH